MSDSVLDANMLRKNEMFLYASFGKRLLAYIIDALVLIPIIVLDFYNNFSLKSFPLALIIGLSAVIYKIIMEGSFSATLGKMAVRIKVVDSQKENISFGEAAVRAWPYILGSVFGLVSISMLYNYPEFIEAKVSNLEDYVVYSEIAQEAINPAVSIPISIASFVLYLVTGLSMLFHDRKQAIHDRTAKTYVINVN